MGWLTDSNPFKIQISCLLRGATILKSGRNAEMGKKIKDVHTDKKKTRRQKKRMGNGKRKQRQKVRIDTRTFLRVGQRLNEEQTSTRRDTEEDREKSFLSFTSFTSFTSPTDSF